MLRIVPLTRDEANELITKLHRHHKRVCGHRFAIGCENGELVGAAIVGRPVARQTDQYRIAEVTRLVSDGTKNVCSMLYAACARAAEAMGFDSIQTFILETEPGTSLRAAGWNFVGMTYPEGWERPSRERMNKHPVCAKQKWEKRFDGKAV
jgi:hypothetical protein